MKNFILPAILFPCPACWPRLLRGSPAAWVCSILLFAWCQGRAQTPTDALMMPAREACFLLGYDAASFDRYWEGVRLRQNETIATVDQMTIMPMAAVGIVDGLNAFVSLPYIRTESSEPNGGFFAGARGFQDLGLAVKYKVLEKQFTASKVMAFGTAGFSTPLTNYLSDYRPYSLGFGAPEFSLRALSQYEWNSGFYLRGMAAHLWRGYTKAERDYYYADGSYYTDWMDVPNAWEFQAVGGKWLFDYRLRLEANFTSLRSTSGDDIRAYNAAQATNKTEFDRLGFNLQYYFKAVKGLGVVAYHTRVVNGRNVPKTSSTGVGLTYQFNYLSKKNDDQAHAQ